MRKLMTLLVAVALLFGVAGAAFANCGADHTNTSSPSPERPPVQS
jgi:hypothetical protein